jgi:allantoate deiminase
MVMTTAERAEQIVERCRALTAITDVAGETTRTFLSPAMRRCNEMVAEWMRSSGMTVRMDAVGNLRGLLPAGDGSARRLVIASHLDTVPNAGAFDGVLGVMLGLAVVEAVRDTSLPFAVEVIGFSEEEGVRFSAPFIGSRGFVGTLDEALLSRVDADGVSVREAIRAYGLTTDSFDDARFAAETFAYLEFHIEQGPLLESLEKPLGVVDAIVGQSRYEVVFEGEANHAGTTPMHLRHDALAAAAEWITTTEAYAAHPNRVVATVGKLNVSPGAVNVIAGEVRTTLDVRSADDRSRQVAAESLIRAAEESGQRRGVRVKSTLHMEQSAVAMDEQLTASLAEAVSTRGVNAVRMVSGAGHDAMIVAPHVPATMLFLRSPRGLSHHPDEAVVVEDVRLALESGVALLRSLGQAHIEEKNNAATR